MGPGQPGPSGPGMQPQMMGQHGQGQGKFPRQQQQQQAMMMPGPSMMSGGQVLPQGHIPPQLQAQMQAQMQGVPGIPGQMQQVPPHVAQQLQMQLPQVNPFSVPEEILHVLEDPALEPPENMQLRQLREIVAKDARQDLNFKLQETRFARKILNKQIELDYLSQLRATRQTHPNISFGDGYMGYGNGWTGGQVRLIYPKDRKRARRKAPEPFIEQEQTNYMANVPEVLAPVRIDFDMDKYRLRDTFTLNVNEKTISVVDLAQNLLEDFYIPLTYTQHIAQSIKEQLNDFHPHVYDAADTNAALSAAVASTSSSSGGISHIKNEPEVKRERETSLLSSSQPITPDVREDKDIEIVATTSNTNSPHVGHANVSATTTAADSDMRITIKLDITVGSHNLIDQFEWDMNCPDNNPEEFAVVMARELALPGEFSTAIAHAIREQTQVFTKTLFLTGHGFDGKPIEDDDVRKEICLSTTQDSCLRPKTLVREFTPQLSEISAVELDRQDKDRERDSRRKRRQGRQGRRAVATLPDVKETIRTFRTPVYSALVPGGIDKRYEFMQKQANKVDESDEEDDTSTSFRATMQTTRRGRPSGRSNRLTSSSPAPTAPLFAPQFQTQTLQTYKQTVTSDGERRQLIVKLKVPRLGQLMRTGYLR